MPSEATIIEKLKKQFKTSDTDVIVGIGDDAAVTRSVLGKQYVYTCDTQVEGTHFQTTQIHPKQLGFRSISAALSDIAAMGALPKYCLVSLFLPKRDDRSYWVEGIMKGIATAAKMYGISVIGGNIAKSAVLSVDIFAIGEVKNAQAIRQDTAHIGDSVLVTGTLGNAHSGWRLLQHPTIPISSKTKAFLLQSHFVPKAKVKEAIVLADLGKITSMIDISDGLSTDLLHLCDASNVGVRLQTAMLPLENHVRQFAKAAKISPLQIALQGGEDYQLLCTTSPKYVDTVIKKIQQTTGTAMTSIGTIVKKSQGKTMVLSDGKILPLTSQGYDHLA